MSADLPSPESSAGARGSENGAVGAAEAMAALLPNLELLASYYRARDAEGDAARRAEATFLREIHRRLEGRSQNEKLTHG